MSIILPTLQGWWNNLRNWIDAHIVSPLERRWNALLGGLRDVWARAAQLPSSLRAAWEGLKTRISNAIKSILPLFGQWYEKVKREITSWAQGAVTWVNQMRGIITSFFQGAGQFWLSIWQNAREKVTLLVQHTEDYFREIVVRTIEWVLDLIIWCVLAYINRIW